MPKKGFKFTDAQRANMSRGHLGQTPWNTGSGGCKRGHEPALYMCLPSGVFICFGCKRENVARYKAKNHEAILFKNRIARYGLSPDEFTLLWDFQKGRCAICYESFDGKKYRIDHDHETGHVRGILCTACNSGLGLLKDSQVVLLHARKYLAKTPAQRLNIMGIAPPQDGESSQLFLDGIE